MTDSSGATVPSGPSGGTPSQAGSDQRQLVVFRLASERFGLDISKVREIILRAPVTRVPSAPDSVDGMLLLRGTVIPVVDLCRRLSLGSAEDTPKSRIIVLDLGAAPVGIIVDEVTEVLRIPASEIQTDLSAASGSERSSITGIAKVGSGLLILLDLEGALSAEALRAFKVPEETIDASAPAEPEPQQVEESVADGSGLGIDIDLIEATFEAIKPQAERVVERFYERLFESYPGVLPLFEHADMAEQRGKLLSAIATVVATLRTPDVLVPHLQALGERHVSYGAQPAHYGAVGETLLATLAEIAGDAWTEAAQQAWAGAYGIAADVMVKAGEALQASDGDAARAAA